MKSFNESIEEEMGMHIYLKEIEVIKDIAPLKKGLKIEIGRPFLFLVGENGVGKTTIMECIADKYGFKDETYMKRSNMKNNIKLIGDVEHILYIDFHAEDKKFSGSFGSDIALQLRQMKASAGESTMALLISSGLAKMKNGLILLDEPCRGLSIKNQILIANIIAKKVLKEGCQVICATHSDIILRYFKGVAQYCFIAKNSETKDVTYEEFMKSQGLENL